MERPLSPGSTSSSTRAQPSAAPSPSPPAPAPSTTTHVYYGSRSVKARIDREVPLAEILRQLVASAQLAVEDKEAEYALREKETGELITDGNYTHHLELGHAFNLCLSPALEATQMVDKLLSFDPPTLKLATFSLRTSIKERAFLTEFLRHGGVDALQEVIKQSSGNTLAYALGGMQSLMEVEDRGWEGLEDGFVSRIVEIIATQPLINISRPSLTILLRLSSRCPPISFADSASIDSSLSRPPTPLERPSSGFSAVWKVVESQPAGARGFLKVVLDKLASSGDTEVVQVAMELINSLYGGAFEVRDHRFGDELEALDGWKTIGKLLETRRTSATSASGDLTPLLTFQYHLVTSLHQQLHTRLTEASYHLFDTIWSSSGLHDSIDEEGEGDSEGERWRKLGFLSENPQYEFEETGVLGLKAFARFAEEETNEFAAALREIHARPAERRCSLAHASSLVLLLLAEHFSLSSAISPSAATVFNPYLLRFWECHALALHFFLRIWAESGASNTAGEIERVRRLTGTQVGRVLSAKGGEKSWFQVRQGFLHADYKEIRNRQLEDLAASDNVSSKAPVRHLRGHLYLQSYEFVRSQRISCLQEGGWFRVPPPGLGAGLGSKREKHLQQRELWRFYRLAANRKVLHYVETTERRPLGPGLEDLPERIDLALITDVVPMSTADTNGNESKTPTKRSFSITSLPVDPRHSRHQRTQSSTSAHTIRSTLPATASSSTSLTFSLLSSEGTLATLQAPSREVYSEWIDGLSLLRPGGGDICTKETADYVHALTEIGVRVKLLDLEGEGVELKDEPGGGRVMGVPDAGARFVYAETM